MHLALCVLFKHTYVKLKVPEGIKVQISLSEYVRAPPEAKSGRKETDGVRLRRERLVEGHSH